MPSISLHFRPASAIASSAALLMRSSEEEPSCLPNAVSPTPVMKLMTVRAFDPAPCSSFRDAPLGADPESRDSPMCNCTSEVRRCAAPRNDDLELPQPSQYDFGKPRTFSAIKLRMSCGLIGAIRGIRDSRKYRST